MQVRRESVRTKPSVKDGIFKMIRRGDVLHVEYEPGNATRYDVLLVPCTGLAVTGTYSGDEPEESRGSGFQVVALLNLTGKAYPMSLTAHWTYLSEKLNLQPPDAMAMAELLRFLSGENVVGEPEVDR